MAVVATPLSNVELTDTFQEWLSSHNNLLDTIANPLSDSAGNGATIGSFVDLYASVSLRVRDPGTGVSSVIIDHSEVVTNVPIRAVSGVLYDDGTLGETANVASVLFDNLDKVTSTLADDDAFVVYDDSALDKTRRITARNAQKYFNVVVSESDVYTQTEKFIQSGDGIIVTANSMSNNIVISSTGPSESGVFGHVENIFIGRNGVEIVANNQNSRVVVSGAFEPSVQLAHSADLVWNVSTNINARVTIAGGASLRVNGTVDGGVYTLLIKQDATGNRSLSFPTSWRWRNGMPGTISQEANSETLLTIRNVAGTIYAAPLMKGLA